MCMPCPPPQKAYTKEWHGLAHYPARRSSQIEKAMKETQFNASASSGAEDRRPKYRVESGVEGFGSFKARAQLHKHQHKRRQTPPRSRRCPAARQRGVVATPECRASYHAGRAAEAVGGATLPSPGRVPASWRHTAKSAQGRANHWSGRGYSTHTARTGRGGEVAGRGRAPLPHSQAEAAGH